MQIINPGLNAIEFKLKTSLVFSLYAYNFVSLSKKYYKNVRVLLHLLNTYTINYLLITQCWHVIYMKLLKNSVRNNRATFFLPDIIKHGMIIIH